MSFKISFFTLVVSSGISLATVITQWTFEGDVTTPATGVGTASLIGGTTATFLEGNPGRGWNTTAYPTQGNTSGTAGVKFAASTIGYSNIAISFDHRASVAASRFASIEYSVDGSNWIGLGTNAGGLEAEKFSSYSFDLSAITAVNGNPNFAFRVVSIFSPVAFDQNSSLNDFAANTAYMRANTDASFTLGGGIGTGNYTTAGTWRFDNVTVRMIPEPSAAILGTFSLLALQRRRR